MPAQAGIHYRRGLNSQSTALMGSRLRGNDDPE